MADLLLRKNAYLEVYRTIHSALIRDLEEALDLSASVPAQSSA